MPYITIRQNGQDLGWRELDGAVVIGRQKECDICLIDMLLSRNHCRIEPASEGWVLVDLESRNGTWHDETQIERMELAPGARVRVGRTTLTYHPGTPPLEGRYISRAINRPSDPHEALAGTVMGMVVADDGCPERPADPWAARRAARPRPTPRPSGESGIFPAIVELSIAAAVHEPSSGACAMLRESLPTDQARMTPDLSDELSVREPVAPRYRPLPRPILLELQVAAEQETRTAAREADGEISATAAIASESSNSRRRRHAPFPLSQEGVILLLALGLLALFRLAVGTSHPDPAIGQPALARAEQPPADSFDIGLMATTVADLPPLSVTTTPQPIDPVASEAIEPAQAEPLDAVSPIKALAASAKRLKQSLNWQTVSGVVKDYQREVRRIVLDAPSIAQTDSTADGR